MDQVTSLIAEKVGDFKVPGHDHRLHHILVVIVEGQAAGKQGVEDDSQGPDIDLLAAVLAAGQHLGRRIAGGAAEGVEQLPRLEFPAESKVGQLRVAALVQQDVLELEVPVDDPLAVDVAEPETDLPEQTPSLELSKAGLLDQIIKQLATGTEFSDQPDRMLGGDDLVELDDVGMV